MTRRNIIWLGIFMIIGAMFFALSPIIAQQDSVYRTYASLVEVDALVRRRFVDDVHDRRLVHGAIRGMMLELDPYSGYIAPDQMADFRRRNTGEYVGIGLELGMAGGGVTVIAPIERSPAMRAGVQPGDTLLTVDGRSVEDLSVLDVSGALSGEPGKTVAVGLRHRNGEVVDLTITRDRVKRPLVAGIRRTTDGGWDYMLDPDRGVAYIRIPHFSEGVSAQFDEALRTLAKRPVAALVIDLRFNPGGMMTEALEIVDRFVASGTLLTTVTRRRAIDTYTARPENTDAQTELAVLINEGSASSSEIVAGSLRDHQRAVIVGERSFGKGSAQSFMELHGGVAGIKLTTAHYQLPSGRIVHRTPENADTGDWGIIPDIHVPVTEREREEIRRWLQQASTSTRGDEAVIDRQLQAAVEALRAKL